MYYIRQVILLALMLIVGVNNIQAQSKTGKDGYKIKVKFNDITDSSVFLVHYYGKPLPTIYRTDSAKLNSKGEATFESDTFTLGGIYMVLLSDKKTYFEILLNNGDEFSIVADSKTLPTGLKFKNSPENERFVKYVTYLSDYGKKYQVLQKELESATTKADTTRMQEKFKALSDDLKDYRKNYTVQYPNTLLSSIFNALTIPEVPAETHYNEDGSVDSSYGYNYYKDHYWDGFDFQDDRLIHTPIYDGRLEEYFNKLVLPIPDTVQAEADILLAKAKGTRDMFKYTLWWITRFVENSKIMGMDAAFVYLVENYYMKGDAYWLEPEDLEKYVDRAHKIAPNVIGNLAPELKMQTIDGKEASLYGVDAKYTLLIFWSPECGHCLTEMPKVDSVYNAVLKDKGFKIFAVKTEGKIEKWKEVIEKNGFDDWIHVHDPERKTRFRADYDIYSTPVLYLLDEKKIIRGKRIDHSNIVEVLEMIERKKKNEKKSK